MRASVLLFCLLLIAVHVKSKPHGKNHVISKSSSLSKGKELEIPKEVNEGEDLPTLVTIEGSSQEQEDMEKSYVGLVSSNQEEDVLEEAEQSETSIPVLLSEEELVDLHQEEATEKEEDSREGEKSESEEAVAQIREEEYEGADKKTEEEKVVSLVKERKDEEPKKEAEEGEVEGMLSVGSEDKAEKVFVSKGGGGEPVAEESNGSTESEIPVNLGLDDDSDMLHPLQTGVVDIPMLNIDSKLPSKVEQGKANIKEEFSSELTPTITGHLEVPFDMQNTEALPQSEEVPEKEELSEGSKDQNKDSQVESKGKINNEKYSKMEAKLQESKNSMELGLAELNEKEDVEMDVEESASITKGKSKKQKKHRVRKHHPQRDEVNSAEKQHNPEIPEPVTSRRTPENAAQKTNRRRAGKWTPSVGMNPVQIRATVDLYPSTRSFWGAGIDRPEGSNDPCENFRCKRGKTCKLNEDKMPFCLCQEPTECPQSASEFDHVCGTDNATYDTSCELFATKCNLEGTKSGHKLQLDYTGPCKFIPQCLNTELVQFPLRMRDWLKNVLLQLYEHENVSPGFLTPKQRFRVKKIFESERRLHAGDHPIDLLAQDFEKNYNMYIYPVHWQFAQMDQHPSDRFLSHSELAPLRVPLVPMEHCTSRFFQECDADKDKQVSFREWAHCFGIKEEDMDVNLLF